jgi:hypothetical protein
MTARKEERTSSKRGIAELLKKLNFGDASISYGKISGESIIDFHEYNESLYGKSEPPFIMSIPVYQAYIATSNGAIIYIDKDGWRWTKDGNARGVAKEDQNILKEFGLKRRKSY